MANSRSKESQSTLAASVTVESAVQQGRTIKPVVIYPFRHPKSTDHFSALLASLSEKRKRKPELLEPTIVVNWQTADRVVWGPGTDYKSAEQNRKEWDAWIAKLEGEAIVTQEWCVDTCQMWLAGLGKSFREKNKASVYWLIPGDFEYAGRAQNGADVLKKMFEIPYYLFDNEHVDICVGEVEVPAASAKQLIDSYGTFGLLYNWFPEDARQIRSKTNKPRSEFFAISHEFLQKALAQRWYAYEHTIILLLEAVKTKRQIARVRLGNIEDESQDRSHLEGAMMQVERMERILKMYWRDCNHDDPNWRERFRRLDSQSQQIRASAMVIFEQLLSGR